MISVSFFLHPSRQENLHAINEQYKKIDLIDEVLVITGTEVDTTFCHSKFKFIYLPGPYTYGQWPFTGLLGRYIFAQMAKNKYIFLQDDDCLFQETSLKKLLEFKLPLVGTKSTPRWFYDNKYQAIPPIKNTEMADIIITRGLLVDTNFMPKVLEYAKQFWISEYNKVFNGEDIFLSRAVSKITKIDKFPFIDDEFIELPVHNVALDRKINKKGSRTKICKEIYEFFDKM